MLEVLWNRLAIGVLYCALCVSFGDAGTDSSTSFIYASGCTDGNSEGLQSTRHTHIAACAGVWAGHVERADELCARGWRVCAWHDRDLLKSITWSDATSLAGCYAINAAQDGGSCQPCISDLKQDDLAGVGRACPHQTYGQHSCISGGQMAVSCCVDTFLRRACAYRAGLASGVLCCKLPGVAPQILVKPSALTHVTTGVTFVLSCQALGTPTPTISWYKDGVRLPNQVARVSVFESGYLLISEARVSDAADYECLVSNSAGNNSAHAQVIVTDHPTGCADGTTDGLHEYERIQACRGTWSGHVRRGRALCARGWRVCGPRHVSLLRLLTWSDVTGVSGCYAYNAANLLNRCTRCHRQEMAGVGAGCRRVRRSQPSCLTQGRVDVYGSGRRKNGCDYDKGVTSGVLCCRKPQRTVPKWHNVAWYVKRPRCRPKCANGAVCIAYNRCQCESGYKGAWCQNPICPTGCASTAYCAEPGECRCLPGYIGERCDRKLRRWRKCHHACLNGGDCHHGSCRCARHYGGSYCQIAFKGTFSSSINDA